MIGKSPAQQAKYNGWLKASKEGTLQAWYAAREAEKAPATPYESPEAAAWRAAYASEQGLGPLSSKWELQGGKLTMVWLLGHHSPPQRPSPPRN